MKPQDYVAFSSLRFDAVEQIDLPGSPEYAIGYA